MKRALIVTAGIIGLTGCGTAGAVVPDSGNPAHCVAAFNYANYWFKVGKQPERATAMVARAMYEIDNIREQGGSVADAKNEGMALTKAYAKDAKQMDSLSLACGKAQDADPQFSSRLPKLLAAARAAEGNTSSN